MKNILIAGGAGFLGSSLCQRLLREGHNVICVDNLCTGLQENLDLLGRYPAFCSLNHNIIEPLVLEGKVDQIYNLACPASPPRYQGTAAIFTMRTCFNGTLNLLELAHCHGASLLQASTSEIYGEPLEHPQRETYRGNVNPVGIRSCYDEGKRISEALCFEYIRQKNVDAKVVRIFNTYGPRMDPKDGRVVSNFICQALRGEDLTVYGDGSQTRSFCYVDDLVEGLIRTMDTPRGFSGPVNLGNPDEFTIGELANKISAKIGGVHITKKSLPADDPTRRNPDISLAKRALGWEPLVSLNDGLDKTIAYFRSIL